MKITYLVANYNNGKYLRDCIDSLNQQTNSNWLCLIADDKSTDDSLEILAPLLNDRIRLITHEQNLGLIRTLRALIAQAETEIVGFLDADDALYPETTELILRAYSKNPTVGFIYSNYANYDSTLSRIIEKGRSCRFKKTSLIAGFVGLLRTFRVSAYLKTSGLDPDILYASDRDLIYKMEEVTKFYFVNRVLYKYRRLPNSESHDPEKRRIGYHSHLQACRLAVRRRGVRGAKWIQYQIAMLARVPYDTNPVFRLPAGLQGVVVVGLKVGIRIMGLFI